MGLYAYISEHDRVNWRKIEDQQLKELFDEALQRDETLMISEHSFLERVSFFKKLQKVTTYKIYHECFMNGHSTYQARQQLSASGSKQIVSAYLYGIINGSLSKERSLNAL